MIDAICKCLETNTVQKSSLSPGLIGFGQCNRLEVRTSQSLYRSDKFFIVNPYEGAHGTNDCSPRVNTRVSQAGD
jgi:hypothetical protein